ncbi:MAG: hypothetical protein IPG08_17665 [Sphingobacteriaceae bacterium]|nr:hypothetical protein [Sphingobacteriaceae bacterium]
MANNKLSMNKENPKRRDEKGDIKSDYKIDWQKIREDRFTYVFRYYDEDKKHYFPHFGLFSALDEALEKAKKDSNFYEKQIYWTPNHPPYDFFIQYHNWQLELLVEYFKEVFEERAFMDGYQPAHKYFKIILPKTLHDEIINCINDFELLPIRDLLFEVIAVAQDKYIDDVAFGNCQKCKS